MNMTNAYHIKLAAVAQVLDRSIIVMNIKHCDRLSIKIMHTQINILNMQDMI
jgi:hypothetical protein